MDEKKLDEALKNVASNPQNRDPENTLEIGQALTSWSSSIQQMLNGRFGKDNVIHLLIMAPTGRETTLSWISSADFKSVKAILEALQQRIKHLEEHQIVIDPLHFGG